MCFSMQAVQAAQVTVEDYAMSYVGLAPLQVVGYEGVLGCIALAILLTIVYYIPGTEGEGLHEDSLDSIHMVLLVPRAHASSICDHSMMSWCKRKFCCAYCQTFVTVADYSLNTNMGDSSCADSQQLGAPLVQCRR